MVLAIIGDGATGSISYRHPEKKKKDLVEHCLTWGGNSVCSRGGQGIRAIGTHREVVGLVRGCGVDRHRITAE